MIYVILHRMLSEHIYESEEYNYREIKREDDLVISKIFTGQYAKRDAVEYINTKCEVMGIANCAKWKNIFGNDVYYAKSKNDIYAAYPYDGTSTIINAKMTTMHEYDYTK